jgi:hypothetical protein
LLWGRADSAKALEDGARSGWDEGVVSAAGAFDQPRSGLGVLQAVAAAVVAIFAGELAGDHLLVQVVGRVSLALGAYWFVPTAWATVVAIEAPIRQRNEARRRWKLEQERANDLQERLERPTAIRREIEDHEVALSSLRVSIERNRSPDVVAGEIESVEHAFTRIRETLGRYDTVQPPSPFDQPFPADIDKAALTMLVEDARRTLGGVGGSIGLALRVLA